jgi:molybdate transport system ATP-binding protein
MSVDKPLHIQARLARADFTLQVDLALPGKGITVLFGPSGSGKTSLLRCVAGLEKAQGMIALGDEVWQDSARRLFKPTWQRDIAYVFQEASLFEHLNVRQNLHFGLKRVGASAHSLDAALALLGIEHLLGRNVASLSGGERQRVAIARALATQPKLLLLDEPLASLDVARRKEVLPWLEKLHEQLQIPMLYVTHSVDELARLADHLVLLERGSVRSCDSIGQAMLSQELALALGEEAGLVTKGQVMAISAADHIAQIRFDGGTLWASDPGLAVGQNVRVRILARDVSLALSEHHDSTLQNRLQGQIASISPDAHPAQALVRVRCGDTLVLARVTARALRQLQLREGDRVWCQVKSVALMV